MYYGIHSESSQWKITASWENMAKGEYKLQTLNGISDICHLHFTGKQHCLQMVSHSAQTAIESLQDILQFVDRLHKYLLVSFYEITNRCNCIDC